MSEKPTHVVYVGCHGIVTTLYYTNAKAANCAHSKIARALRDKYDLRKNDIKTIVELTDILGKHVFSITAIQASGVNDLTVFPKPDTKKDESQ